MSQAYNVAADLETRLAEAREALAFEVGPTPWFDQFAGGLDRWRDEPADRESEEWAQWKARDTERWVTNRPAAPVIVRPGWKSEQFALLGHWAVEAVAYLYPRAFGPQAERVAVEALQNALVGIGEVLVRHSLLCGASRVEAVQDMQATVRRALAVAAVERSAA